jgi:serine protease AprX
MPATAGAQARDPLPKGLARQVESGASAIQFLVEGPQAEIDRLAESYGLRVVNRLAGGAMLEGSGAGLTALTGDPNVKGVSENHRVMSTMAVTTHATGANQLWRSAGNSGNFGGLTGRNVGVAIIDSGVADHSDLGRVRFRKDFTGENGGGDLYGHGTHVAGIISGSGRGSMVGGDTTYLGMAPGVDLIDLRVLGADGTGQVANVIAAIDYAVANRERLGIDVINISLGHPVVEGSYRTDPLAKAVERAVASGIVVVASAGNLGKTDDGTPIVGAVVSPGYTPGAITVGALNTRGTVARSDDAIATYSSRGPVGNPDDESTWEIKPDLVAPGNAIVAAGAAGGRAMPATVGLCAAIRLAASIARGPLTQCCE